MKKSKKIILTISAVTLTAGVLLTGIGYMKGGRFGFVFSDGKFISADSIEEEKQPFMLEKKKLDLNMTTVGKSLLEQSIG